MARQCGTWGQTVFNQSSDMTGYTDMGLDSNTEIQDKK